MTEKFTCAKCGGVFNEGWSDEEATLRENERLREAVALFIEELDDPCRRNQQEPNSVWISKTLEKLARAASKFPIQGVTHKRSFEGEADV